jgi:putative ribosome biogenesis GTPase RsgA
MWWNARTARTCMRFRAARRAMPPWATTCAGTGLGDQGVITAIDPRKNLLYRSDQFKSKLLAANLDQVIIVLATEPGFSTTCWPRAGVGRSAGIRRW